VSATSCKLARETILREYGADEFLVEDGAIASQVQIPGKSGLYDKVLELVGTVILKDSLRRKRPGGTACITGAVGHAWAINGFGPFEHILSTTELTIYSGGNS
jgi:NADPH:quinone reductase-like Zn-dependent oxidoreductase